MKPFVLKVMTGTIRRIGNPEASKTRERVWESAIFKTETPGPVWLGVSGLSGDEEADTVNHGGPEKALFAYPAGHYEHWRRELPDAQGLGIGTMGENLAVLYMDESAVSIGDIYRFGEAVIQVSQPRKPCWKPARRAGVADFALRIQNSGRTGWYFRVLKEGFVRSGTALERIERPYPQWTIDVCNRMLYDRGRDLRQAAELASCPLLADSFRQLLQKRLNSN